MRILIHHHHADGWRQALAARLPQAEIATSDEDAATVADYLVVWQPPTGLLRQQTQLKGIINLGAGVDALLNNPALPRAVPVVKLRGAGMEPFMADYVRHGVFYYQRNFDRYLAQETSREWRTWPIVAKADWPVTVLGLGAIGRHVAATLAADGFPVRGWSRSAKRIDGVQCSHGAAALPALLADTKTLVTLLPDTPATQGIVDAGLLAQLPDGATLINPGRGTLVNTAALLAALDAPEGRGRLRGAMLDVFADEPLPADSPLWAHPRVRITPHVSAPTPIAAAAEQVAAAITALDVGKPVTTVDIAAGY